MRLGSESIRIPLLRNSAKRSRDVKGLCRERFFVQWGERDETQGIGGALEAADELEEKFTKEKKTGKVEAEGKGPTIERCQAKHEPHDDIDEECKGDFEDCGKTRLSC